MVHTSVDYALHQLSEIQACQDDFKPIEDHDLYYDIRVIWEEACLGDLEWYCDPFKGISQTDEYPKIQSYKRELMFLKMILWCFATWEDTEDANLRSMLTTLEGIWDDFRERIDDNVLFKTEHGKKDWDLLTCLLEGTIQQCKLLMVDYCYVLLDSSLQCKPLPSDQTLQFFHVVLANMVAFLSHKADVIPMVQKLMDIFIERLNLSESFFRLMTTHEGIDCKELRALVLCFQTFANEAASLVFLFWASAANEDLTFEAKVNHILCDMHQKIIKPCGSNVTALYLGALKEIKLQPSEEPFLHQEVVEGLVNLHLDDLVHASKDDLRIVREGLIFLLTFVSSPPEGCNQDEQLAPICNQIDVLFSKCTYLILSPHLIKNDHFTFDKMLLNDFAEKVEETKDKVKQLYGKVLDSSSYNFPKTNGLGFYYLLLQNLEKLKKNQDSDTTFIPFAKNYIVRIVDELVSLRPLVNGIFELQNEQMDFEGTWSQLINLAYRIEHIINSCSVCIHPFWYKMTSLSVILDQIQDVKRKLEEVGNWKIHYASVLPSSIRSSTAPPERTRFSMITEEEVISLKDQASKIIDELTGGHESLSIISIIGMGGLGKTTLAKSVCNSKKVRHYFHQVAWGNVSQVLNKRNFFLEIVCHLKSCTKDELKSMTEDDLAHHLWRCLSGQKYLIVVDDVWTIKEWNAIKSSFPDDKNKSRVIFTTREAKVALDAKSSRHNLRPFFDDESLKLLYMKVFGKDDCPTSFSELGKTIARNCKGLPLSVVVVAGLLARNKTSSSWWKEIAEATCQFIGQECKQIIGYSYKHLPEHLKSCFLYIGIYKEDELIRAKKLRRLWIGEGFVNKSMGKSLRIMAKEYLRDLVDRNLVTTVGSTLGGEIRTCRLHDLIGDFCRKQAGEDNFLWLRDGHVASDSSHSTRRNSYRISVQRSFDDVEPTIMETIHSVIFRGEMGISKFVVEKLKLVQVLHMEGDTRSIFLNHLVHLRYLAAWQLHGKVPESICNLWKLETLILERRGVNFKLPKTIWRMKMLTHLEFHRGEFDLDDEDDNEESQLLGNLQFLSDIGLHNNTIARAVLQRLPNIQKLTCSLDDSKAIGEVFTIDFLHNLESLTLSSYITDLHVSFPLTLKRVYFCDFDDCSEDVLSAIGKLPCLEVLKLNMPSERWEVEDDQFKKLKCLELCLIHLEEWNVPFYSFNCLEQLSFLRCHSLKEIPAYFAECPTLHKIETRECRKELVCSAIQILQEQMDNGNEIQFCEATTF